MIDNVIKRATWLELLLDLIFVYAVSKATHILAHAQDGHISVNQYITFFLVMIPIWWTWTGHTLFATRFDTDDTAQRILTLVQMLALVFWATFINADFDLNYLGYLLFYVLIRIILIMMYWRATRHNPVAFPIAKRLSIGFSLGLSVVILSLLFEPPIRYFILYAGISIEIITPLVSRNILNSVPVNSHHLPERYGLFTIILLGESVIMIASALSESSLTAYTVGAAIAGFLLMATLWWLYFDLMENVILGKALGAGQRIIYGHLFVYTGLSVLAVFIWFAIFPVLTLTHHISLFIIGFVLLGAGFISVFAIHSLIKKKYLLLYCLFFVATCISTVMSIWATKQVH
jgi:low temperature requirement protein LtrA